jgi:glycosylphosphatidylinositol transamidase (GPIT) subunit GPI8
MENNFGIEEFGSVSEILRKIKYFKMKKTIVIFAVIVLLSLYLLFKILSRWM